MHETWHTDDNTLSENSYFMRLRAAEILWFAQERRKIRLSASLRFLKSNRIFSYFTTAPDIKRKFKHKYLDGINKNNNTMHIDLVGVELVAKILRNSLGIKKSNIELIEHIISGVIFASFPFGGNILKNIKDMSMIDAMMGKWIERLFPNQARRIEMRRGSDRIGPLSRKIMRKSARSVFCNYQRTARGRPMSKWEAGGILYNIDDNAKCIKEVVAQFIVGHEFGHYVWNNKGSYYDSIMIRLNCDFETRDTSLDEELFADIVALDFIVNVAMEKRDQIHEMKKSLFVGFFVLSFFDYHNVGVGIINTGRGMLTSEIRLKYMENMIKSADLLSHDLKETLLLTARDSKTSSMFFLIDIIDIMKMFMEMINISVDACLDGEDLPILTVNF